MRLKEQTSFFLEGERGREEENRADYFLSLAGGGGSRDGQEDTKFEVELFFFPSWKKVQDAGGVVIVVVAENKGFTSECP